MPKKFSVICKREVYDIANKELLPGNIIAVSRFNSAPLEVYLLTSITEKSLILGGVKLERKYDKITQKYNYASKAGPSVSIKKLYDTVLQNEVVKIEHPVFLIGNQYMANVMSAVDYMTSTGLFPKEYVLGESVPFKAA